MKQIIQICIEDTEFPMLSKIKKDDLGELCSKIFQDGYKLNFPTNENNRSLDIIRDKYEDKLDKFDDILNELLGISSSSSKKGRLTEDIIFINLKQRFKDYNLEETRNKSHYGDCILTSNNKNSKLKILIEIKNYNRTVDSEEIDKLINDMKFTGIKYALFISLKSGFVGYKHMSIQEFKYNNDIYTIIYLPHIMDDINKLESGILLIEKINDYHMYLKNYSEINEIKMLGDNIINHLKELEDIHDESIRIKSKFLKMETNIKNNLNDFYLNLRNNEISIKEKLNRIWRSINSEIGLVQNQLIEKKRIETYLDQLLKDTSQDNKNLSLILETVYKNNYNIENIGCNKNLYSIEKDGILVGTINIDKRSIRVNLIDSKIDIEFTNTNINNKIKLLETNLKSNIEV